MIETVLQLKSLEKPIVFPLYDADNPVTEANQRRVPNALIAKIMNALRICSFCQIYAAKLEIGTLNKDLLRSETLGLLELVKEQILLLKLETENVSFKTTENEKDPGSVSIRMDIRLS